MKDSAVDPRICRLLRRSWNLLISEQALIVPRTFEDHKTYFLKAPEIKIKDKTFYLSDKGRTATSYMLDVLCAVPEIRDSHTRQEVWGPLLNEYERMLSNAIDSGLVNDIEEFLPKLLNELNNHKRQRRLYACVVGVQVEGLEYVVIGRVKLRPFNEQLEAGLQSPVDKDDEFFHGSVQPFIEKNFAGGLCFEAEYDANEEKSIELFDRDCKLAISVLRLLVCLLARDKIHFVKAPIRLSADAVPPSRPMLSQDLKSYSITIHRGSNYVSRGPLFDPDNLKILRTSWFWDDLCNVLASGSRTELEDAIVTGIKWIGDAQDEGDMASAFLKYWICLEGLFTGRSKKVTDNLARSISVLLVFGGYHFFKDADFEPLFGDIKTLYGIRSDIVHRGRSKRLTGPRLANLCNYSVYAIFSLLGLRAEGYTKRHEFHAQVERLCKRARHARTKNGEST